GLLAQTEGQYPIIALTEKSEDVLRGKTGVDLIKVKIREEKRSSLVPEASVPYLKDLFEQLRQLRTVFAKRENVPPYVIFSDATLAELAAYLPQSEAEMLQISGVGDLKLEKYGRGFLKKINAYCIENKLASRIHLKPRKGRQKNRAKRGANGKD